MTAELKPGGLTDQYGRVATDLRVSLTDRCNLRCTYCMPAEGLDWFPRDEVLTDDEVNRLLTIGVELLGINEIRFTGGEPLLRRGLEGIIAHAASLRTTGGVRPELSLTTNGLGLERRAEALRDAGLNRVNVSLDTLDAERFAAMTRRDRLHDVLSGLAGAAAAGLGPIKVNAVAMRDSSEPDVVPLAQFCLENGYELRFIEQMPLGADAHWSSVDLVTQAEILDLLGTQFTLTPDTVPRGAAPAERWTVAADANQPGGRIGVIASVTKPFCGSCDRTRLTADGQMRNCLFAQSETDLRTGLRSDLSDVEIAAIWQGGQFTKTPGHGMLDPGFEPPSRTMSSIGG